MHGHTVYSPPPPEPPPSPALSRDLSPDGVKTVLVGAAIGLGAYLIPFTRFVFSYLNVLTHELGHTVASWIFGYPAIPAFDWRYGGGVTMSSGRSLPVLLVVGALLATVLYLNLEHAKTRNIVLVGLGIYALAAVTPIHQVIGLAMGHLMELIIAGIFLFRALAGRSITHAVERPLYAAAGLFMILHNLSLSWGLMTDVDAREVYGMAKGGGHWMDLSRLSIDYLSLSLPTVAFGLFLACWLTPIVVYAVYKWEPVLIGQNA